jgi:plasmid stability protein
MAHVLIRDLSSAAVTTLKTRAKRNHRSLQGEVKAILEETAERTKAIERFRRETARLRKSFGNRAFSDSAALIRKDRER